MTFTPQNVTGPVQDDEPEAIGGRHSPLRRCIVTGSVGPASGMIRFVLDPRGQLVPDVAGSLPGRGFWVTAQEEVLRQGLSSKAYSKAARKPVTIPEGLYDVTTGLLKKRCLETLGLARRAGLAIFGFEKVYEVLKSDRATVVVTAYDAGKDGREKIKNLAKGKAHVECFDSIALGSVCGRDRIIHAALLPGGLTDKFLEDAKRYTGLVPVPHDPLAPMPGPTQ